MAWWVDMIVCRCNTNKLIAFWVISLTLVSCRFSKEEQQEESLPFYNTAEFDAEWINPSDEAYASIHTIAPFALTNQLGQLITNDSLKGKIYVANFFFTTCSGICPKMVNNLETLQQKFVSNPKVKLVSFSVTPWADSVERLKTYGELQGINPSRWHLLTGPKEAIYTLGRKSYFIEKGLGLKKTNEEFLHTESMVLIDQKGRIRGIYNATQKVDAGRVAEDIEILLRENG